MLAIVCLLYFWFTWCTFLVQFGGFSVCLGGGFQFVCSHFSLLENCSLGNTKHPKNKSYNKKVLLHECKRHTTLRIASTCFSGQRGGGTLLGGTLLGGILGPPPGPAQGGYPRWGVPQVHPPPGPGWEGTTISWMGYHHQLDGIPQSAGWDTPLPISWIGYPFSPISWTGYPPKV